MPWNHAFLFILSLNLDSFKGKWWQHPKRALVLKRKISSNKYRSQKVKKVVTLSLSYYLHELREYCKNSPSLVVTSYTEKFQDFKKRYVIIFETFQNTAYFQTLLWIMQQKIVTKFELRFWRVYRTFQFFTKISCNQAHLEKRLSYTIHKRQIGQ